MKRAPLWKITYHAHWQRAAGPDIPQGVFDGWKLCVLFATLLTTINSLLSSRRFQPGMTHERNIMVKKVVKWSSLFVSESNHDIYLLDTNMASSCFATQKYFSINPRASLGVSKARAFTHERARVNENTHTRLTQAREIL